MFRVSLRILLACYQRIPTSDLHFRSDVHDMQLLFGQDGQSYSSLANNDADLVRQQGSLQRLFGGLLQVVPKGRHDQRLGSH